MRQFILFISMFLVKGLAAQTLAIGAFTIVPSNPTVNDQVLVITKVTSPAQGVKVATYQATSGTYTHVLRNCYWPGMAAAIKVFVDTFNLGQLPAGTHAVDFGARTSSSPTSCVLTDSSFASTSFVVSGVPTGLAEHRPAEIKLWPNPAANTLFWQSAAPVRGVEIIDACGRIVGRMEQGTSQGNIQIGHLTPGIYALRVYSEGQASSYYRFLKN